MAIRRIRTTVGTALVAVLAGVTLTAVPAAAANSPTTTITTSTGDVITMTKVAQAASSEPVCRVAVNGVDWGGSAFCNYNLAHYEFPNGTVQVFVIGTDYAVWTRWQSTTLSAWTSLGGQIKRGTADLDAYGYPYVIGSGYTPTLYVPGNQTGWVLYHRVRTPSGSWTAWSQD